MVTLVLVIATGVSAFTARKAHDKYADHPPLRGYCSNCGVVASHSFHQSGMSWKKSGGMAILLGAAGLGVSSLLARNIYRCSNCSHLTLQCRVPGCKGMALAGEYYDDELCGHCRTGNDQSSLHKACQDQETLAKVKDVMTAMQSGIDVLEARIKELEADRAKHIELIRQLNQMLREKKTELAKIAPTASP